MAPETRARADVVGNDKRSVGVGGRVGGKRSVGAVENSNKVCVPLHVTKSRPRLQHDIISSAF
eukprot:SAG31_NODE_186_length_20918_cov_26.890917_7_plen_63_part_00